MTAVTDTPAAPEAGAAPEPQEAAMNAVREWAQGYLASISEKSTSRLAQIASHSNGSGGGIESRIGEPTVGQYVAFDVAATSPIQVSGLPPYQPGKVIAAGELAFLGAL